MAALPHVPDGENPWTVYREWSKDAAYGQTPSPGLSARLIVLGSVLVYCILAGVTYSILLAVDYRRRKRGWWLYRFVKRPAGDDRWLVTNQHCMTTFGFLVCSGVAVGYIRAMYFQTVVQGSRASLGYWTSFIGLPVFLTGYLISMSSLQAYLVAADRLQASRVKVTPKWANRLYIALGAFFFVELVVAASITSTRWIRVWRAYERLDVALAAAEAQWQGASDLRTLAKILVQYNEFVKCAQNLLKFKTFTNLSYVVASIFILLLNAGALGLVLMISRQIKGISERLHNHHIDWAQQGSAPTFAPVFAPSSRTVTLTSQSPREGDQDQDQEEEKHLGRSSRKGSKDSPKDEKRLSSLLPSLNLFARRPAYDRSDSVESQEMRKMFGLRRAQRELVTVGTLCVTMAIALTAINIFIYADAYKLTRNWVLSEIAYFLECWAFAVLIAVTGTILVVNSVRSILEPDEGGDGILMGQGPVNSAHSMPVLATIHVQ